ncbi:MAG: heme-binding protein [Alphaproteobacteria bacterium]|nr:heme-binding protein [Alphaproteobacteria bacterium]
MDFFKPSHTLTHRAVMTMLAAAIEKADDLGQPQCIVIVDRSGETLGEIRMDGAKYLSRKSALAKARTAASIGAPTPSIPEQVRAGIAAATSGEVTGLPGGLPVVFQGDIAGAVGVGSGSGEQDIAVANAALSAIGVETF